MHPARSAGAAGGHAHGVRVRGLRRGGHEGRRVRFSHQAGGQRGAGRRSGEGPGVRPLPCAPGQRLPPRRRGTGNHGGRVAPHASPQGSGATGRPKRGHHPDYRGVRLGQGARGGRSPCRERPRAQTPRESELRGPARSTAGERTLRLQEGRLHRRREGQARPLRAGGWRRALPRRGGRAAPGRAGQVVARDSGTDRRTLGRRGRRAGGCAAPRRHQPRSPDHGPRGDVSRGPLLPPQCAGGPHAAPARPTGRPPPAGRHVAGEAGPQEPPGSPRRDPGIHPSPGPARLAGQRARAGERAGARPGAHSDG